MQKTYILDTNVLIQAPYALQSFEDNHLVLPLAVLEELDGLKNAEGERGANARQVIRYLESLRTAGNLLEGVPLPGGDFPHDGVAALTERLKGRFPFLTDYWAARLIRAYGSEAEAVLGNARTAADLGRDFGATLIEAEVRWLMTHEFARAAADVVWRRTKLGLRLTREQIDALDAFMAGAGHGAVSPAAE